MHWFITYGGKLNQMYAYWKRLAQDRQGRGMWPQLESRKSELGGGSEVSFYASYIIK